jgi:Mor family transcriptional regulator
VNPQTLKPALAMPPTRRDGLIELSSAEIEPLDRVLPIDWPDTWREFAHSMYLTLFTHSEQARPADELAALTLELVQGIGQDLGGDQPYIPVGEFARGSSNGAAAAAASRPREAMFRRCRPGLVPLSSDELEPLERTYPGDCPSVWREFGHSLYQTLLRRPKERQSADELAGLAFELVRGIAQDLGGTQPYIPVGHFLSANDRAAAIRREFKGNNHRHLAATYGVSMSRVRQILAAKKKPESPSSTRTEKP